jgi:hypothetical protein
MPAHSGIQCDGCRCNPIEGDRYKCLECPNFDQCHNCFKEKLQGNNSSHSANHSVALMLVDGDIGSSFTFSMTMNPRGKNYFRLPFISHGILRRLP